MEFKFVQMDLLVEQDSQSQQLINFCRIKSLVYLSTFFSFNYFSFLPSSNVKLGLIQIFHHFLTFGGASKNFFLHF